MMMPFRRQRLDGPLESAARRRRRKRAAKDRLAGIGAERLEPRAMLAIYVAGGGGLSNYTVIASDRADDVYVRQTVDDTLQVANNSSFINVPGDPGYQATTAAAADILYVTNGRAATGPGSVYRGDNRSIGNGGPGYQADAVLSTTTVYSLSNGDINTANAISGKLRHAGSEWDFSKPVGADSLFTFTLKSGSPTVAPKSASIVAGNTAIARGQGVRGTLTIQWTAPVATVLDPGAAPGQADPPVVESITYEYFELIASPSWTDINLVPSATPAPKYQFDIVSPPGFPRPGEIEGGIIPGTVSGSIVFDDDVPSGAGATPANKGLGAIAFTTDFRGGGTLYFGTQTFADLDWVRVRGSIASTATGVTINLAFTNRFGGSRLGPDSSIVNPGTVRIGGVSFLR